MYKLFLFFKNKSKSEKKKKRNSNTNIRIFFFFFFFPSTPNIPRSFFIDAESRSITFIHDTHPYRFRDNLSRLESNREHLSFDVVLSWVSLPKPNTQREFSITVLHIPDRDTWDTFFLGRKFDVRVPAPCSVVSGEDDVHFASGVHFW